MLDEKVENIELFFGNKQCAYRTDQIFNGHTNRNVLKKYILELGTKSVVNKKRHVEKLIRNGGTEVAVLGHVSWTCLWYFKKPLFPSL